LLHLLLWRGREKSRAFGASGLGRIECGERVHHPAQSLKALDELSFEVRRHMVRRLVYALSQLVRRIEDRLQRFFRHPVVRELTIDGCLVARVGSERHHESEMQIGEERHEDPAPFASRLVLSLGIGEELNAKIVRHRLYPMQPAESGEQDIELAGISQRVCRKFCNLLLDCLHF